MAKPVFTEASAIAPSRADFGRSTSGECASAVRSGVDARPDPGTGRDRPGDPAIMGSRESSYTAAPDRCRIASLSGGRCSAIELEIVTMEAARLSEIC